MEERAGNKTLHFTHDVIAGALGTRRATISVAASDLQAAGAISYTPGAITIRSRRTLRRLACACYRVINTKRSL
jgi:CRP-like cAMP-binding protein